MSKTEIAAIEAVTKLVSDAADKSYQEGWHAGRAALRDELIAWFEVADTAPKPVEKPRKNRLIPIAEPEPPASVPTQAVDLEVNPEAPKITSAEDAVFEVLSDLAEKFKSGVEPAAVVEFLRDSPLPLDDKAVRTALKNLLLSGAVGRVQEGRFMPRLREAEVAE